MNIALIRKAIKLVPAVIPYLTGKARWVAFTTMSKAEIIYVLDKDSKDVEAWGEAFSLGRKTYEFMLNQIVGLVRGVYSNNVTNFIDIMANLISGQLTQAYRQAWEDEGFTDMFMPDYLTESLEAMILNQYSFVDNYYLDIVNARELRQSMAPLLARAEQWANQWNAAYREALRLIRTANGGNLVWRKGQTEKGCSTCANLDGIVMSAREWEELDVHPRGYPNSKLECEGGGTANKCDCELIPTEQRRSPNAYSKVQGIVNVSQ